ncbi:MAG: class III signal peptide-containing protein [archaeon]|jgi:Flp pilus assembly pilin Flp
MEQKAQVHCQLRKCERGQGAIEYLLIIGAAILVIAIVIIAITSVVGTGKTSTTEAAADINSQNNQLKCMKDVNTLGGCTSTYTNCTCCTNFTKTVNSKCPQN